MRNISFALTTPQFLDGTKSVTRRLGWLHLRVGDRLMGCKKCMGFRKGERLERLGVIEVISFRREYLNRMVADPRYGAAECVREGFSDLSPQEFVAHFCATHRGCHPHTTISRIEFRHVREDEA